MEVIYTGVKKGRMEKRMETTILGLYRESGKENGNYNIWVIQGEWQREWTLFNLGYIGRMEKKMETTTVRWRYW